MGTLKRSAIGAALIGTIACASQSAHARSFLGGGFSQTYSDAITGQNQFIGANGKHYWFVNPGADNYHQDFYERPTAQTYNNAFASGLVQGYSSNVTQGNNYVAASQYFEYVDIVKGNVAANGSQLNFGIELFGVNKVGDNGVRTADFGESSFYNIRISNDPNGRGGFLLTASNAKDLTSTWQANESFAYLDSNRGIGGFGGIGTVNETSNLNGYETNIISDGKLANNQTALQVRRITSGGRPVVEFSLNVSALNAAHQAFALDLDAPLYIVFEATRGLKGNSNYLWNDKYSFAQAGNPYSTVGLGNIYELDTLSGMFHLPAPAAWIVMLVPATMARRRRRREV